MHCSAASITIRCSMPSMSPPGDRDSRRSGGGGDWSKRWGGGGVPQGLQETRGRLERKVSEESTQSGWGAGTAAVADVASDGSGVVCGGSGGGGGGYCGGGYCGSPTAHLVAGAAGWASGLTPSQSDSIRFVFDPIRSAIQCTLTTLASSTPA